MPLEPGDRVQIMSGPMMGCTGTVVKAIDYGPAEIALDARTVVVSQGAIVIEQFFNLTAAQDAAETEAPANASIG